MRYLCSVTEVMTLGAGTWYRSWPLSSLGEF